MTVKLYDEDPYLTQAHAQVLSCAPTKGGWLAELDQTIFFARGGGQPCDLGRVGMAQVLDVYEEDGRVLHLLDREAPLGQTQLVLDWDRRWEHMQQHLGQHILSTVIDDLFGVPTVIARIEADNAHIELGRELTSEQLLDAEARAREVIAQDRAVRWFFVPPEEAEKLPVRGHLTPHDRVRLVEIADFDLNGCGGTHCRSTGGVEDIVIYGSCHVRGCFRIYIGSGVRAKAIRRQRALVLMAAQRLLDCQTPEEFSDKLEQEHVRRLALEDSVKELRAHALESDRLRLLAGAQDVGGWSLICEETGMGDQKHWKALCDAVTAERRAVALFALRRDGQLTVVLGRTKGKQGPDLGAYVKQWMSRFGGRGGGNAILAQGSMPDEEQTIQAVREGFAAIRRELEQEGGATI